MLIKVKWLGQFKIDHLINFSNDTSIKDFFLTKEKFKVPILINWGDGIFKFSLLSSCLLFKILFYLVLYRKINWKTSFKKLIHIKKWVSLKKYLAGLNNLDNKISQKYSKFIQIYLLETKNYTPKKTLSKILNK